MVPEAAPEAAPAAAAPVAAPAPQQAAVPPFNFGGLGVPAANPAVTAPANLPGVSTQAQQATAAIHHGGVTPGAAPHAPLQPFGQGYPHPLPYMSPFMYGGLPYGYGMHAAYGMAHPGFGMPFAHGAQQLHPGQPHALTDPDSIQRQIDQLHAQLAVLQATSATLGSFPTHTIPGASTMQMPLPAGMAQAPSSAHVPPPSQPAVVPPDDADDLEDKMPAPRGESQHATSELYTPTSASLAPVESTIPPAELTEAERRRAELRQRYNRIYAPSTSNEEEKNDQSE